MKWKPQWHNRNEVGFDQGNSWNSFGPNKFRLSDQPSKKLSILIDKTELTPLEIRTISCKMNLDKERNQMTVESYGISDFIQQLKDLPDQAFRDKMRKQNIIVMNCDTRTLSFLFHFLLSIFRMDLHNQSHVISHWCHMTTVGK